MVTSFDEIGKVLDEKGGYVKTYWSGELASELKIKEAFQATSRCISEDEYPPEGAIDPADNKPAKYIIYYARAY